MILYHLDRLNTFPSELDRQIIYPIRTNNLSEANTLFESFYTKGISKTGERYLNVFTVDKTVDAFENLRIFTIEYIFETVRLEHFPQLPSRFTSLFACQAKEDVVLWYNTLKPNTTSISDATVKVIETSGATFVADSFWRDNKLILNSEDGSQLEVFNPFAYYIRAQKYWTGERSTNCHPEILCELPVNVLDSIPISNFIGS